MLVAEEPIINLSSNQGNYGLRVPDLMPEEYLSGFFGRIAIHNHFNNVTDLHSFLAIKTHNKHARSTPILMCLSELLGMDAIHLWKNHTVYTSKSLHFDKENILNKLNVSHNSAKNKKIKCKFMQSLLCAECVKNDIEKLGYTYWRTEHQRLESKYCNTHIDQELYTATTNHRLYFSPEWHLKKGAYYIS